MDCRNLYFFSILIMLPLLHSESQAQQLSWTVKSEGDSLIVANGDTTIRMIPLKRYIGPDKYKHFTASLISTIFIYKSFRHTGNVNHNRGKAIAFSITFGGGLAKEIYDGTKNGNKFSWKDILADLFGIGAGIMIANQP